MPRFKVIVTGVGVNIPPDGSTGFATTRFVRAQSQDQAAQLALELVAAAVAADPAFASSPSPLLAVDAVARVRSPFKLSRPNKGYTFVGPSASLEDALALERKVGKGWVL